MNVTTINNIDHSLLHQALCKLKMTKCDENVIISNNSRNMQGEKGQCFFLCEFKV
jgi:hypothetical protein